MLPACHAEILGAVPPNAAPPPLACAVNRPYGAYPPYTSRVWTVPNLLAWLAKDSIPNLVPSPDTKAAMERVQSQAAHAMLCLAAENATTQVLVRQSDGIQGLIALLYLRRSSREAQKHAACALWHLASQAECRTTIVDAGGVKCVPPALECPRPSTPHAPAWPRPPHDAPR